MRIPNIPAEYHPDLSDLKQMACPIVERAWFDSVSRLYDEQAPARPKGWLRRKLHRHRRLQDHWDYLKQVMPDLWWLQRGTVVDIGPGAGELLEVVRWLGHDTIGVDAPLNSEGGMGNHYLRVCRMMHERQRLDVRYENAKGWNPVWLVESCWMVNSRGSLEQVMHQYLEGEPHHLHHDCNRLAWREEDGTEIAIRALINRWASWLKPGGVLSIYANGARNWQWADEVIVRAAERAGLSVGRDMETERWRRFVR